MPLTEEEKKKQAQLSQQQASKESALDAMYNENKAYLDKQKQLQMEDAYVNQELMNKYLNESLAQQGLNNSGVANLYKQQLNTDYMNTRANIANQYAQDQLDLLNQYNADKKAEQDKVQSQMYDMYTNKIANSVNNYGFIDEDTQSALNQYLIDNADKFGSDYQSLLQSQLDLYKGSEDQIKAYNEGNYQSYLDDLSVRIGDAEAITDEDYDTLVAELDTVKGKIGQANYDNALKTLTAFKTMGDVIESLTAEGRISSTNYTQLKQSLDTLKEQGAITPAAYNQILTKLDEYKLTVSEEEAAYQKSLQEGLFDTSEDFLTGQKLGKTNYLKNSTDPMFEKWVRTGASGLVNAFKDVGKTISDFWKKNVWN